MLFREIFNLERLKTRIPTPSQYYLTFDVLDLEVLPHIINFSHELGYEFRSIFVDRHLIEVI